ncbi:MAG: FG-GAP-like repeat-containing protein [Bifidobacteriaceae bacterium]|jgi:hypothetical protein|nr:FG-GAP-like repeat-containing protein [Bifidobacteriaceae bacterium]
MNSSANARQRHWAGAVSALAIGLVAVGPALPADAVPTGPPVFVALSASGVGAVDPAAVADAVSQALDAAPGDPITVKPSESAAPAGEAAVEAEAGGVATLDAAPVGSAEVSLDQPGGEVEVLVTDALATAEFSVAGVTWEGDVEPGRVLARAYQDDEWTEWFDLEAADGPDPTSAEGRRAKPGSGPLVVAGSTAIQIQVLSEPGGELPDGVAPAVVPLNAEEQDPDPSAAGVSDAVSALGSPGASKPGRAQAVESVTGTVLGAAPTASPAKPTINERSLWNAAPADYSGNTPKGQPEVASRLVGAIIHHQEGNNNYTQAQVPGIIRSIQTWHMGNNGWDDIGYNFLIDKFGGIWEGRQGGVDKNVVGAHAFEFNTGSTGVCFLGSMETAEPTAVALDAAGRLVTWRLSLAGITTLTGNTVYPADSRHQSKPIVAGHRDVNATTCPGRYLYAKLDFIRTYTAANPDPEPKPEPEPEPQPFGDFKQVVASPDMDKDGRGEILAVDGVGRLFMFPMVSATALGAPRQIGSGWTGFTLLAPGDWDGNGYADLMSINSRGLLIFYPNDGHLLFTSRVIGSGWTGYVAQPSADLDGDGKRDLLAVEPGGARMFLYRSNGRGDFLPGRTQVGSGWARWTLRAAGDLNRDGIGDILGVSPTGYLYYYPGVRGGGFGASKCVGNGWTPWLLLGGGDLTGDGAADIAGLHLDLRVVNLYPGLGTGWFGGALRIASGW